MSGDRKIFFLRCWKCRKRVADSECLARDGECAQCQEDVNSSVYRGACTIWHLEAEAGPDWIKSAIEEVDWKAGKLNCPYCRARLGAFSFIDLTKCSCGHPAVAHLCKSKVDVCFPATPPNLVSSLPSAPKLDRESNAKTGEMVMGPPRRDSGQFLLDEEKCTSPSGLLMEALCLEVPTSRKPPSQDVSKTGCLKKSESASSLFFSHRKSRSLDIKLNGNTSILEIEPGQPAFPLLNTSFVDNPTLDVTRSPTKLVLRLSENSSSLLNSPVDLRGPTEVSNTSSSSPSTSSAVLAESTPSEDLVLSAGESGPTPLFQPEPNSSAAANQRLLTKKEKNKLKSLRRKQRKREKWLHDYRPINKSNLSSDEEQEEGNITEKEGYTCAVCLDVYFNPYMCYPCQHVFCEPCLRTLARDNPSRTPCPLCRTIIAIVHFQKELSKSAADSFPNEYFRRKQNFQRAHCAKWPLPNCKRFFGFFRDFRRRLSPAGRRYFPHGGYQFDFEDDSHGWRFNLDMIIVYIYSVNWVIGFIVFFLLFYFLFLSG
ncbi:E3 ubiquitin-protein ligase RNF180 [Hyperolius riggenbachi]|uniref:E3 ubiquitin-protein ligase RNF180 n=1 Tax=Hyperolius riggenbachi TaxID=752182 RepID=UPI0035A2AE14